MQKLERRKRTFLPEQFELTNWEVISPFYTDLKNRAIESLSDLKKWLSDRSELETFISEDVGWRYIRMTCHTENIEYRDSYTYYITEIDPLIAPITNELDSKLLSSEWKNGLDFEGDLIMLKGIQTNFDVFRTENIPLFTDIQTKQQEYGAIVGAMMVEIDGKEYTLQQAGVLIQNPDREIREKAYSAINERRKSNEEVLNTLYTDLIQLRHQVALNAGFSNFRDYMFKAMGRYDYTAQDCFNFHEAIKNEVVPLLNVMAKERKAKLKVDSLRPWDLQVNPDNLPALKPFTTGDELLTKTINCFTKLNPFLGQCLEIMKNMDHLDLVSRKGKAPGGYNYPLDEIGVPFIFMNATSTLQDTITMLHEGGHAVHSIVTRDLPYAAHRNLTSEIAELASMSMELMSMAAWDEYFTSDEDIKRAKSEHLEHIIETLPWVATIDKFQHWIYENPFHTLEQRTEMWNKIHSEFSSSEIDWSGIEAYKDIVWQKQLHLFEVPFYYIEYGIAQLGAIGVWKNYRENPEKGLTQYLDALKLGYTKSIGEIYETAGVKFDFTSSTINELMNVVEAELDLCK